MRSRATSSRTAGARSAPWRRARALARVSRGSARKANARAHAVRTTNVLNRGHSRTDRRSGTRDTCDDAAHVASSESVQITSDRPLSQLTTLGVGGSARYYARAERESDVLEAVRFAEREGVPLRVLGGGSNVVVSDEAFPGLVLHMATRGFALEGGDDAFALIAAAGEPWDETVARSVAENLQGLECLSGIPGRVGATPLQNVGAYGQDVSETIERVRALDRRDGTVREFSNADCHFEYRQSLFKTTEVDRYVVLSVRFL